MVDEKVELMKTSRVSNDSKFGTDSEISAQDVELICIYIRLKSNSHVD